MKRKKFIKKLMGHGMQRNEARFHSDHVIICHEIAGKNRWPGSRWTYLNKYKITAQLRGYIPLQEG